VENADKCEIRKYINGFDHVFLDLAWTKREEDVMNRARRQSKSWLFENADHWTEEGKSEMGALRLEGDGLVKNIRGFTLLDILNEKEKPKAKVIVATGFYSKAVAHFCAERWNTRVFKKWEDQDKIEAFMQSSLT
jgi:hypothetical protein